ncbi:MAG: c-type cytochrome [Myxococcales bacterium]|nr:c-type cytochrome [Myxococcales bacterium]
MRTLTTGLGLAAAALLLGLTACGDSSKPSGTATGKDGTAEAKKIFKDRCVPCHGESGKGDGPGAATLTPKPRNYSDGEWQKQVTDEEIKKTILYGGAAVQKSPAMPSAPDLEAKPEVLDGLVKIIRGFGK